MTDTRFGWSYTEGITTKAEIAKALGLKVFDTALPQNWVAAAYARGFDVVPHFVWSYDAEPRFGEPYPVTEAGQAMLRRMATYL